jgi:hypothetical protein
MFGDAKRPPRTVETLLSGITSAKEVFIGA